MHSSAYHSLLHKADPHLIPEKKIVRRRKGVHEQTYWVRPRKLGPEALLPQHAPPPATLVDLWASALDLYPSLDDFIIRPGLRREKARFEKLVSHNGKAYLKFRGAYGNTIYTPVFKEALQMQPGDEIELPFTSVLYNNPDFPYTTGPQSLKWLRQSTVDMALDALIGRGVPLSDDTIAFIRRHGTPEQLDLLDMATNPARKDELTAYLKKGDIEYLLSRGETEMRQNYDASQIAKRLLQDIAQYGTPVQQARFNALKEYVANHAIKNARRLMQYGDFFDDIPEHLNLAKEMAVSPAQLAEALELEEVYQAQKAKTKKTTAKKSNRKGK